MKNLKKEIRKEVLLKRDALLKNDRIDKSKMIFEKLTLLESFIKASAVMCFINFGSEVETLDFLQYCLGLGKELAVPKIIKSDKDLKEMIAVRINSISEDLEAGHYGILEPRDEAGKIIRPEEIDLIVVPGVAFDIQRYRVGYGGGYYDRFLLRTLKSCSKVGVAFDLQICPELPREDHDLPVDIIITETGVI